MKKKRLRLVTTIALLAALAGGSGGTAWGQLSPGAVNNVFGAGESAFIGQGNHGTQQVSAPWALPRTFIYHTLPDASDPATSYSGSFTHALVVPPPDIQLGGVKNTVIHAYTGNGFAMAWISVLNRVSQYNGNPSCGPSGGNCNAPSYPDDNYYLNTIANSYTTPTTFCGDAVGSIYEFSFNTQNYTNYNTWSNQAPCGYPLFQAGPQPLLGPWGFEVWTHITGRSGAVKLAANPTNRPVGLYTSTIDGFYQKTWAGGTFDSSNPTDIFYPTDDDVALVQFNGNSLMTGAALASQRKLKSDKTAPLGSNSGLTNWGVETTTQSFTQLSNYRRPTTVIVEPGAMGTPAANHLFNSLIVKDIEWQYLVDSVSATPGTGQQLSSCCSGKSKAYAWTVAWTSDAPYTGETLVDGASSPMLGFAWKTM